MEVCLISNVSSGDKQWAAYFNSSGDSGTQRDQPDGIAIDGQGNVFVTGVSSDISSRQYSLVKYDDNGLNNGLYSMTDVSFPLSAIAINDSGHIYVSSSVIRDSRTAGSNITKYNFDGRELWNSIVSGSVREIKLDISGNIYVAGVGRNVTDQTADYKVTKLNSHGEQQWSADFDVSSDWVRAMAVDDFGNACLTGFTTPRYMESRYATVKYDSREHPL